jgi:hypothetical protein
MSGWDCSVHEREERYAYRISVQNLKGIYHFGGVVVNGKIILKWMFQK